MDTTEVKPRYKFDESGHVHTLDEKPLIGTTTAMDVLGKPLTWWASGMAVSEFGWMHEKDGTPQERINHAFGVWQEISRLTPKEYLSKLDKAYRAHLTARDAAAKDGTDIHAQIERYILYCIGRCGGKAQPPRTDTGPGPFFAKWAVENVKRFLWAEGHCYSERLWVGGISDCGAELATGQTAVIDFKRSKAVYFSHFVQLAGYCTQVKENGLFTDAGVNIVAPVQPHVMIVFAFGGKEIRQEIFDSSYTKAFEAILHLYKLQKDFDLDGNQ